MSRRPYLLIFDIDGTLLKPDTYYTIEAIRKGLFDDNFLSGFLTDPDYQVAIASFNHDPEITKSPPYGGRRLARIILDLQYPHVYTNHIVEDDFIQAWIFSNFQYAQIYGKNKHIINILNAYKQKYNSDP